MEDANVMKVIAARGRLFVVFCHRQFLKQT